MTVSQSESESESKLELELESELESEVEAEVELEELELEDAYTKKEGVVGAMPPWILAFSLVRMAFVN